MFLLSFYKICAYSNITLRVMCFKAILFKDCQCAFESGQEATCGGKDIHELNIKYFEYLKLPKRVAFSTGIVKYDSTGKAISMPVPSQVFAHVFLE